MSSADYAEYLDDLDALREKWEARERGVQEQYDRCPWWRLYRKTKLHAHLQGMNEGLLRLTIRIIEARAFPTQHISAHDSSGTQT